MLERRMRIAPPLPGHYLFTLELERTYAWYSSSSLLRDGA